MPDIRIQALGPVRAWRNGAPLDLGPAAQRAVLGLLALACGLPVPRTELMTGLWLERPPPPSAANVIQTYVKRLRRILEPDRSPRAPSVVLQHVGDGYALNLSASMVDVAQFRTWVGSAVAAQRRGELDRAAELLEQALKLWQGPPLADVPLLADHPKVVALANERLAALVRYGEVMVAAGRAAEGLSALEEAAAAQPLNESWHAMLVRAYQAAGRRGQAFATYHAVRRRLADELGVDPGSELSEAYATLLRTTPPPERARDATPRPTAPTLATLPADVPDFVGRSSELARLDQLLDSIENESTVDVGTKVVVISGPPGVGKTALAVRWGHRVAHRFPDGQLYLNLRGFGPAGTATDVPEALRWFFDVLGVPTEQIPSTVDAKVALYRSLLAGRRMLIVLDNAKDASQVRPLVPGAGGCLILVTSRNQLPGLIAADGAVPLPLGLLGGDDARELLARRIGAARTAGEPEAVAEILDSCGGLPLALVVIAARASINSTLPLAALADQVRQSRDRLDVLRTDGDPSTDVRAVLSGSYQALSPKAGRLFRLLGLHPGPEFTLPAVASLAAVTIPEATDLLAELVTASLIAELPGGRYTQHDLLRAFASELTEHVDRSRHRRAARRRLIEHYLHSAYTADRLLFPSRDPLPLAPPAPGVSPECPDDTKQALEWFAAERAVLVGAVKLAQSVSPRHAWQLAWSVSTFLERRGHWDDLVATQIVAIAAAHETADSAAEATARRLLGRAYIRLGRMDDAHAELMRALDLFRQAGDLTGQSNTHLNLALLFDRRGEYAQSLDHAQRALDLFRITNDRHGQARAQNTVGWYHALLGDYARALQLCSDALAQLQDIGDRLNQAAAWDSIGYAHSHLGDHARAIIDYQHAVDLYRDAGDRQVLAFALTHLGDAYHAAGNHQAAHAVWREALDTLEELDPVEAEKVRARLATRA